MNSARIITNKTLASSLRAPMQTFLTSPSKIAPRMTGVAATHKMATPKVTWGSKTNLSMGLSSAPSSRSTISWQQKVRVVFR
ncbi:hypothetical protein TrVE_jg2754 [Triparma verrucosa]|uniref:Uncharacterized protein n=1 Tax=Triparma verrucosa TaxID=1606542 RepID=A0A9W7CND7_9STRA|nr:hypothetical protein TrVE_jg2754 [Triparma verrucosa]